MKNTKKGFTLVELLVVIAIVAILATVAIIGYTSFTRKADISNDTVIAGELNTLLAATDATDPIESFDDVKDALYANGFYLANLNTKTEGCYFVWDSANNQIILVDGNDNFKVLFSKTEPSSNKADWHFAVSDLSKVAAIEAAGYTVETIVTDLPALGEALASGGEFHIDRSLIIDKENLLVFNSANPTVIDLGNSPLNTSGILVEDGADVIPVEVMQGNVTINGGHISTAGAAVNAHDLPITIALRTRKGSNLNINGTTFENTNSAGQIKIGGTAYLKDVVINSTKVGVETFYNGQLTLENVTINAKASDNAQNYGVCVWACNYDHKGFEGDNDNNGHSGNATVTIKSGTYTGVGSASYGIIVACGGNVVIEGGTFINSNGGNVFTVVSGTGGSIVVTGGTFSADPTAYVNTETHNVTLVDGLYTVTAK